MVVRLQVMQQELSVMIIISTRKPISTSIPEPSPPSQCYYLSNLRGVHLSLIIWNFRKSER